MCRLAMRNGEYFFFGRQPCRRNRRPGGGGGLGWGSIAFLAATSNRWCPLAQRVHDPGPTLAPLCPRADPQMGDEGIDQSVLFLIAGGGMTRTPRRLSMTEILILITIRSITWPQGRGRATGAVEVKTCPAVTFWPGRIKVAPLSLTRPVSMSCFSFSRLATIPKPPGQESIEHLAGRSSAPAATGRRRRITLGGGLGSGGLRRHGPETGRNMPSPQDHRHIAMYAPDPGRRQPSSSWRLPPHEGRVPGPSFEPASWFLAEGLPRDRDMTTRGGPGSALRLANGSDCQLILTVDPAAGGRPAAISRLAQPYP